MKKTLLIVGAVGIILLSLFGCEFIGSNDKVPSNEEVEAAFKKADAVVKMLWGTGLEVDESNKYAYEENNIYYAVKYENINSLNSLRSYLESMFSAQIADELININFAYSPRFIEKDNKLYQAQYDYSIGVLYHETAEKDTTIEKESDVKFVCSRDKILYENDKSESDGKVYKFNYTYEKLGDKWLFTEFPIVKPFTDADYDYSNFNNSYSIVTEIRGISDVQKMLEKAGEADSWFKLSSYIGTMNDCTIYISDWITYSRAYNNKFKTLKDMENYLLTLFSEDIVESMISGIRFMNIDGQLYFSDGAKGSWFVKTIDEHIEKINDNKYVCFWSFVDGFPEDTDEGKEVYTVEYVYEYVNGRWIFTDFPYYGDVKSIIR